MNSTEARQRYQSVEVARAYDRIRFTSIRGNVLDVLEKRALKKGLDQVLCELPNPDVLDLPCGTGRITRVLLDRGLSVTGGDISASMMEVAKEKLAGHGDRLAFRRLDVENLDLPDASYDLVTCIRLFNHLPAPERRRALSEMARVTRSFILVNVSFSSASYRHAMGLKKRLGVPLPKEPFSWEELEREAAANGLKIENHFYELRFLSEVVVLLLRKI